MSNLKIVVLSGLFFLIALLLQIASLDNRPFFTRGEAREALVVQNMLEERDFILPLQSPQELVFIETKPPMFHWLAAASSVALGGISELSVRLPSALSAALIELLLFFFLLRFVGIKQAALAVIILTGTLEWNRSATHARVDMVFALGTTLTLVALFFFIKTGKPETGKRILLAVAAGLFGALAVLAKGPFGLIYPWVVAMICFFASSGYNLRRFISETPWVSIASSVLISVVASGAWYALAYERGGATFVQVHLLEENMGRFVEMGGAKFEHENPFYFSLVYLFTSFLPFSLLLPAMVVWLYSKRRELVSGGVTPLFFSFVWFATLLVAVTISTSKRDVYLLPAFPALAYLLAAALSDAAAPGRIRAIARRITSPVLLIVSTIILATAVLVVPARWVIGQPLALPFVSLPRIAPFVEIVFAPLWVAALLGAVGVIFLYARREYLRESFGSGSIGLSLATILLTAVINSAIIPVVAADSAPSLFVSKMKTIVEAGDPLVQYKHCFFPAMYYAERDIPTVFSVEDLPRTLEGYVLVRKDSLNEVLALLENDTVVLESVNNSANGRDKLVLVRYSRADLTS